MSVRAANHHGRGRHTETLGNDFADSIRELAVQADAVDAEEDPLRSRPAHRQRARVERIGDLLRHRPFRYEQPVDEVRKADQHGDEEVAVAGEVLRVSSRRRGRRER